MNFLWPGLLALLGLLPLMIAAYLWMLQRKRRYTVRYSSLALVRGALGQTSWLRRHLPFALLVVSIGVLTIAFARPAATVNVPTSQRTIILAMDVSGSMCQTDIQPSRLRAAQAAALDFILEQKTVSQIGIVAFAGFAELIQLPTTDLELLEDAVDSLITGRRTAIGSAIVTAIDAIAEVDPSISPVQAEDGFDVASVLPDGIYAPAIVVLLTDGANNSGIGPRDAALLAADRGVRVYTIGFGTASGGARMAMCGGQRLNAGLFGPGFGSGRGQFRRGLDEHSLREIAGITGGAYFSAESTGELREVFENLPLHLITRQETMEVSVFFTGLGAILAALSLLLSLLWQPFP